MKTHPVTTCFFVFCLSAVTLIAIGCGGSKSLSTMTARELFEHGKQQYDKDKYLKAIDIFQACVYSYPGETIVDTAQYFLALSYFGNEEFEVAQVEFNRLARNYPSSAYFEQAIFMRAVCFYEMTPTHYGLDQTELVTAVRQLNDFIIDFPESDAAEDARKYLLAARTRMAHKRFESGIVYKRMGNYDAAGVYFQNVIDNYTDTKYAAEATYELACIDFRLKNFENARREFDNFCTVFAEHELVPKAKEKAIEAAFKSGEAAFKRGEYELAQAKLESFKKDFPDNDFNEKVDQYLSKIAAASDEGRQVENADS
ncbi:MAG: outer membrane protein assembly factor BamD [candidate division Zixibacteria bacterium]|nr:outer membrane protein assembly factor BamD [candidate division Zixibacteria bacterium]